MSVAHSWGTTAAERRLPMPCDDLLPEAALVVHRGIDVRAPAALLYRWVCQLRAAPYSYDWIDNAGRRSPRELTPGLDRLEVGQPVMTIFALTGFEPGRHLTLRMRSGAARRLFGDIAGTYLVLPRSDTGVTSSRLLVRLAVAVPPGAYGRLVRAVLPWGDLVMMRAQLRTLKRLAERDAGRLDAQ